MKDKFISWLPLSPRPELTAKIRKAVGDIDHQISDMIINANQSMRDENVKKYKRT